jgi:hypothetical protein
MHANILRECLEGRFRKKRAVFSMRLLLQRPAVRWPKRLFRIALKIAAGRRRRISL